MYCNAAIRSGVGELLLVQCSSCAVNKLIGLEFRVRVWYGEQMSTEVIFGGEQVSGGGGKYIHLLFTKIGSTNMQCYL